MSTIEERAKEAAMLDNNHSLSWKPIKEAPITGQTVILFSKRTHKFYDGYYEGNDYYSINELVVPARNFDCYIDRFTFFTESGLREMIDKLN